MDFYIDFYLGLKVPVAMETNLINCNPNKWK